MTNTLQCTDDACNAASNEEHLALAMFWKIATRLSCNISKKAIDEPEHPRTSGESRHLEGTAVSCAWLRAHSSADLGKLRVRATLSTVHSMKSSVGVESFALASLRRVFPNL
eukprot:TRINITY_DN26079_c0_g1_i2.p3 TRINITY_DN26079_c0_g1~~TRINITY_DN26079_c0_g1_i2.p3  ORF type:complete len:121 (-),score=6.61 TRINITY_DN26079_c0_g1_i2:1201-1536(-)